MTVCAVMLVKDEADVIEATVRHLLTQVDYVIVADNLSTDGTRDVLKSIRDDVGERRMLVRDDDEPGYYQARKTTALAQIAYEAGFEWVVPCDADEVWHSAFGRLGDVLTQHSESGYDVVTAEMYDHVPTSKDDPDDANPTTRIRWRRERRGALPKVACRLRPDLQIGMGNHVASYTDTQHVLVREWGVTIRHFPYRSPEQFVRKAVNGLAAYEAAPDVGDEYGGHWRAYGQMVRDHGEQAAIDWYHAWFYSDAPPALPRSARESDRAAGLEPGRLKDDPAPVEATPSA